MKLNGIGIEEGKKRKYEVTSICIKGHEIRQNEMVWNLLSSLKARQDVSPETQFHG